MHRKKQQPLPDTDIAVLGLLMEKPSYGYELEQRIKERGMRNWTRIEQSSIYNSLHRLSRRGLVESEKKEVDGRLRRIYELTDNGIQTLQQEVYRLLSKPPKPILSFDLGIANIYSLPREKAIEALLKYKGHLKQGMEFLKQGSARFRSLGVPIAAWLFERPMIEIKARISWLDGTIEEIKQTRFPGENPPQESPQKED